MSPSVVNLDHGGAVELPPGLPGVGQRGGQLHVPEMIDPGDLGPQAGATIGVRPWSTTPPGSRTSEAGSIGPTQLLGRVVPLHRAAAAGREEVTPVEGVPDGRHSVLGGATSS